MHDSTADIAKIREGNLTCAMTQILVPTLLAEGYQFVGLDEVPEMQATAQARLQCTFQGSNGAFISPQNGGGGEVRVDGPTIGAWEPIGVDYVLPSKVALAATNGRFISAQDGGGGDVLANGPAIGAWETFDLIPIGDEKVAFRTITGNFLGRETVAGGKLMASAASIGDLEVFSFRGL